MGDGTGILVVDDLVDTGKTLELVRRLYPKAHFATVYAKPQGRAMVDTYITEVSQDTWIFFPWDMALQYVRPYRRGVGASRRVRDHGRTRGVLAPCARAQFAQRGQPIDFARNLVRSQPNLKKC